MHCILRIEGYFSEIILRAAATLDPLSDIMAKNLLIPTLLITSSITVDKCAAVWCSLERSSSFRRYSFLELVISIKAQMLLPRGSVHPSKANKII